MAGTKKQLSTSMSDKVFDDLYLLVYFWKLKGKRVSIGGIVEEAITDYLKAYEAELNTARALKCNLIGELIDDRN